VARGQIIPARRALRDDRSEERRALEQERDRRATQACLEDLLREELEAVDVSPEVN
jgi:hypothetical protein